MGYKSDWVFPTLKQTSVLWNIASTITFAAVGLFSKILMEWLNTTTVYNKGVIDRAIDGRPRHVPLVTISNHYSCFDDPGLWGTLSMKQLTNQKRIRWSLAAHDICFTNVFHSYFFALGKCVPVVRGRGVYQKALDFCLAKLQAGDWVHIFPEGRVNESKELLRFKWGVGRLIYESPVLPIVVPMWHIGMDSILPNDPPYILHVHNRITLNYGRPIELADLVTSLRATNATTREARKAITDRLQHELMMLKAETEKLHAIGAPS
ncbi:tafazzin [Bacillus rossius redtenbacheri]|uniref:tafazzin n=1 Tax=Bacillus rossius redtenbacheri TaxID=93214 RepID=UPI002FDE66F6